MKKAWLLIVLFASFAMASQDVPSWRSNYNKALQLIAQAKYQDGVDYLRMAAADKPISEILEDPDGKLEYLPYLQLGICYSQLGKQQLAMEFFDLEDALPAIRQSTEAQALLKEYRSKISTRQPTGTQAQKSIRDYQRKGYLLPDAEVIQMKEDIRKQCKLPKTDEHQYPWYYHYELGLALQKKSDWQRALDSFINALDDRDRPQKFSRIYGMWFIDYYPYYYIGLAHYNLGNWKCADSSFLLSQMMEDIPRDSDEFRNLVELKADADKHLIEVNK
jgi:tetratricopeptide (TPR) repeat protein